MESGSACGSPREEVAGDVGSALVGLTVKGVLPLQSTNTGRVSPFRVSWNLHVRASEYKKEKLWLTQFFIW